MVNMIGDGLTVLKNIVKKMTTNFWRCDANNSFMAAWKVADVLVEPNSITANS